MISHLETESPDIVTSRWIAACIAFLILVFLSLTSLSTGPLSGLGSFGLSQLRQVCGVLEMEASSHLLLSQRPDGQLSKESHISALIHCVQGLSLCQTSQLIQRKGNFTMPNNNDEVSQDLQGVLEAEQVRLVKLLLGKGC